MLSFFLQLLISGIITGSVYALIALGFTLVYNSTSILNFSQGEFVMIGAVFSAVLLSTFNLPLFVVFILVILISAIVGFLVERIAVRVLQPKNPTPIIMVMARLAMSIIISNITRFVVGTSQFYVPPIIKGGISIGSVNISAQEIIVIAYLLLTVFIMWFFLNKTMYGIAIKATGVNKYAAGLMGININTIIIISFILTSVLAGIGGMLIVPLIASSAVMGLPLAVKGFIAAILGGLTNPFAGIVGGLIIGTLESLISGYISSTLVEIIVYLLLPIALILFPNGLLGRLKA